MNCLTIIHRDHTLSVEVALDIDKGVYFTPCLSLVNVTLPPGYHIGVTASTGDLADTHDVIAFKMREIQPTVQDDAMKAEIAAAEEVKAKHIGAVSNSDKVRT